MLTTKRARAVSLILLAIAVCRIALAMYSGLDADRGDFYATLPGAYAETLNPALWNSPDLQEASGYLRAEYLYGPTQYFTILPLIFLDSYAELAAWLLVLYLPIILLSAYLMWRSYRLFGDPPRYAFGAVFASTCLFAPLLQAYGQREFEVFVLFVLTAALYALFTRREGIAGALIGYVTWFKFFPLAFLPYFVARRWRAATAGFLVSSLVMLAMTEIFLDLSNFRSVIDLAGTESRFAVDQFCEAWAVPETRRFAEANHTRAGVKWALCSFESRWPWLSAQWMHAGALVLILAGMAIGYRRVSRRLPIDEREERWRRALEVSVVVTVPWMFLHAHYYYLIFAIVPLNALLVRYLCDVGRGEFPKRLGLWLMAYVLLGALVVPSSVLSQMLGRDFWPFYMRYNLYFAGEVLLLVLIVWEYMTLTVGPVGEASGSDFWLGRWRDWRWAGRRPVPSVGPRPAAASAPEGARLV